MRSFQVKRGEWQQIIVNSEKWGTLCGDGTDFAFHVRFAPEGHDLDNVLIGLQGGGVCVFEEDCSAKMASAPGLFNAQDDIPYNIAVSSLDPEVSPFLPTGLKYTSPTAIRMSLQVVARQKTSENYNCRDTAPLICEQPSKWFETFYGKKWITQVKLDSGPTRSKLSLVAGRRVPMEQTTTITGS